MAFESNTGIDVSNHYGPRDTGGTVGSKTTGDNARIFNLDLDAAADERTPADVKVLKDTLVQEVIFEGTAGTATVSVGAQDVTAATYASPIKVTADGDLTYVTGTGTGKVKVITMTPEA